MKSTTLLTATSLLLLFALSNPNSYASACAFSGLTAQQEKEDDGSDEDGKEEKKKIATVKIESKPIQVYQTFDGRFESTQMQEIKTDYLKWSDLEISKVVDEGSAVSSGQTLLEFDSESLDKAIVEAEFALHNAEFALADAQLALKESEQTFELEKAEIERTWKIAQEDYEYYKKVSAPERVKDLEFDQKSAGYRLEYSKDELDQLEQMYTEDELTEESEEIVLKRARRSVESAERYMNRSLLRIKKEKEIEIPRTAKQRENAYREAALAYETAKIKLPIRKERKVIALAKAEFELNEKRKSLEEMVSDRKKMSLSSPANGVLYYGRCVRGKWVGASGAAARRLEVGKKLSAKKVVMTVLDPSNLMIRADVEESNINLLAPRLNGLARVKSAGTATIPVMIKSVASIPLDNGKFNCELTADGLKNVQVMPGMACKVSVLVYDKENAIAAPKASVFTDNDGISNYVFVMKDEKPMKTEVKIGHTSGEFVEIIDGVSVGDEIAKAKP